MARLAATICLILVDILRHAFSYVQANSTNASVLWKPNQNGYSIFQKLLKALSIADKNLMEITTKNCHVNILVLFIWVLFFMLAVWARLKDEDLRIRKMPIDLADNAFENHYIYLLIIKTGSRYLD
ncbi:hypothetical protein HELRODRAFT_165228 [Helobdella robusta]|uniref:Uncharacterized protein n=1 Tax=Helobdella robusta TaxID=6412 RepID=T1EWG7_HELRO|nr:hypothetical protein HELRODRAFT_165228 [Helobdella robusta]ESN93069.1 hypothetical protein HELRODRAFT_165228 [Helobdella robusta]